MAALDNFDPIAYLNEPRWQKVKLGLERITELLDKLGNPQNNLSFVHVAGTNGKGSTCAFISSILQAAGYRVGLFTSPYVYEFQERIQINSVPIARDDLCRETLCVRDIAEAMREKPTEFELMTAVAFQYFSHKHCDIVICEVGLGGRFDSTNVISSVEVSAITPVSLDHCAVLGRTYAAIAREKAGIIKRGVPVVSAPQHPDVKQVLMHVAQSFKSPLSFVDTAGLSGSPRCFAYQKFSNLELRLLGSYQTMNAALALEAVCVLRARGWEVDENALRQGLLSTRWPGRFEIIQEHPPIVLDGGHNPQGADALIDTLRLCFPSRRIVFVVGVLADKSYEVMLKRLASYENAHAFICVPVDNPRSLAPDKSARVLRHCVQGEVVTQSSFDQVPQKALSLLPDKGAICVCGSLYLLGQAKQSFSELC